MASVRNAITIHRPIEDIFAVITDVEQTGRWFPANVEEHWTSPPPYGVGSTRHAVARVMGRRSENDAVVTEYDPPRRGQIRTTSGPPVTVTIDLRPVADGTRVDVTSEIGLAGLTRPFGPLASAFYGRAWTRGLRTLKRMLEAGVL